MPLLDRDVRRIRQGAAEADARGWLQPAQLALVHRRGWLKMLAPRSCGGAELPLPAAVRLEEALAAADGSLGWVVTLCAGAGWFAGFLPPPLAREVMVTRRVCLAGSGAPSGVADRDGDGYRIDGRWAHASGAPMATHFTLNAVVRDGGPAPDRPATPRVRAFILPAADVQIVPDWHAIGLRATASHAFRVHDRWVPARHGFDIGAEAATVDGALYRFPFLALAFVTLAANLAGMAGRFIELALPLVRHRQASGGEASTDPPLVHQAQQDLAAARAGFHALLDSAWQRVESGEGASAAEIDALQLSSLVLAKAARSAVDGLYPYCGLRGADPRSEINRVWRDFHTATQHALLLA